MSLLYELNQVSRMDRSSVGGKAAVLGELIQAGLPVPPGFCLTVDAEEAMSGVLWDAILAAWRQLVSNTSPVVVRSSGIEEDSQEASFAGQYETILNVRDEQALEAAIRRCWDSARSDRVRAYRPGLARSFRLAVLVQRQVKSEKSGVLFTQDPLSGDSSQVLIEATAGLGVQVVSGQIAPFRAWVDRQGKVTADSGEPVLSTRECQELANIARKIESILGPGQDIEWAIEGEQVWVLQARTIPIAKASVPLEQVWTRGNAGEVLSQPVTPLTWAIFRATLENDSSSVWRRKSAQEALSSVRIYQGRVYVQARAMLDSFCYLPAVSPAVVRQALGTELPQQAASYRKPTGVTVLAAQAAFVLNCAGLLPRLEWLVKGLPALPDVHTGYSDAKLGVREGIQALLDWTAECFRLHVKVTGYAIGAFALLFACYRHFHGEPSVGFYKALRAQADLRTAAQGLRLRELAEMARSSPDLLQIVRSAPNWDGLVSELKAVGRDDYSLQLQEFLCQNSARSAGEFELATPRWGEDPSFILGVIKSQLDRPGSVSLPDQQFPSPSFRLSGAKTGPFEGLLFRRLLGSYRRFSSLREAVKYRLIEGYAALRQGFIYWGRALQEAGWLQEVDDIFYLTPDEIVGLETGEVNQVDVFQLIGDRRRERENWQMQAAPVLLIGDLPARQRSFTAGDSLKGIPCSPGAVTGKARVLADISQVNMFQSGEILVTPHTDPGWTPLFLNCLAIVTELGGFLSHGATVAREYGLPCVASVAGASALIQNGDLVRVDGTNGIVTILQKSALGA